MAAIVQLIQPQVDGVANTAWFIRWASGYLGWASNADTQLAASMGIAGTPMKMGLDQYNRMLAEATAGWDESMAEVAIRSAGGTP